MRALCDCEARFDRVASADTSSAYGQLCAALLETAVKRARRCGYLAIPRGPPSRAKIVGLCAAAVADAQSTKLR